ncbi:MAG: DNA primase [Deltaproteobacteria bacterium]|nr:DNA primase [Deltaproteobacteria bacterium]
MPFSDAFIAEVREATDILAVIGQYVDLKRAGSNSYKGLCPFHAERTPSFHVNPQDKFFHCFGCNTGGDVYKFLGLAAGLSFPEAVRELAKRAGISVPEPDGRSALADREAQRRKQRLLDAMRRASEIFQDNLWRPAATGVRNYLRKRGVDDEVARTFGLGYSLDDWDHLTRTLVSEGFERGILLESGLSKAREGAGKGCYDAFRGRLMIPVIDQDGKVVAFGGRLAGEGRTIHQDAPKYVNSPVTPIYKKGRLLFGLPQARPYLKALGAAYVVEGYFDLIALASVGIRNVVAALGTAFTQAQVNLLKGKAKELYLLFDGDTAGREAAKKSLPKLLNAEIEGRVLTLPDGDDPDTFARREGPDAVLALAEGARDILDYAVARVMEAHPSTLIGQAQAMREVRELIAEVPDGAKGQLLRRMFAEKLGVDPKLFSLLEDKAKEAPAPGRQGPADEADHDGAQLPFDPVAGSILRHVIVYPETAGRLRELALYWPEDPSLFLQREMLAQLDAVGRVEPGKLMLRGHDGLLGLVSAAALTPRSLDPESAAQVFREYAQRLRQRGVNTALMRLSSGMAEAEARGDHQGMARIMEEQRRLREEKKRLDSPSPGMTMG